MNKLAKVAFLVFIPIAGVASQPAGIITVRVVDQAGNPVSGANVWMLPADGKIHVSAVPECTTDDSGTCARDHLEFGRYVVTAGKESDGYPNMGLNLFRHDKQPLFAEITPGVPDATVAFTLGPKAASIVLNVIDASSGAPVKNPVITLRPAEHPNAYLTIGHHMNSRVLIPTDEDILVQVSAEGYKPWSIETQPGATHANAVRLHSGETREFTASLQPQ